MLGLGQGPGHLREGAVGVSPCGGACWVAASGTVSLLSGYVASWAEGKPWHRPSSPGWPWAHRVGPAETYLIPGTSQDLGLDPV